MVDTKELTLAILEHAETIAHETLTSELEVDGLIVWAEDNKPEYIKNRRMLLSKYSGDGDG